MSEFSIRALRPEDWQVFKAIRLEALKLYPGVYGTTHDEEATYPDQQWIDRISNPKGRIFGMFCQDRLVGLNGVFTHRDDPSEKTALMGMWYMSPDYKGRGLFPDLVQAGIGWVQAQGRFEKIRVNHRGGNADSEANILKAGFRHIGTESWVWPDGVEAAYCMYEMRLKS